LTKETKIENPNNQEDNDLDLDLEERYMIRNVTMFGTTSKSLKTWT
jgi:hypothetical protein